MKKLILLLLLFSIPCFALGFALADDEPGPEHVVALKVHVCAHLPYLHGWCSKEKALNFIDLVLQVKPQVCVEIGAFGGSSVLPVAYALKLLNKGIVIGIDPWDKIEVLKYFDPKEDAKNIEYWDKFVDFDNIYHSYLNMISYHGLEKYCKTLRMTSEKAASQLETIDILHIDGNHNEAVALQDVKLYLPKVRMGGYVWLNDSTWPCMQPAIELLQEHCDVVRLIDNGNCILFKKR
jgi:hypothetical protein